jgi:hypothetical protein
MVPLKKYTPWMLALFFGAVYLLTPTALYYWDGVVFATVCEIGSLHETIHPHHLLFNFVSDILFELVRMHAPGVRALSFLIFMSSIFGALTIYFSHLIFRTIFNREGLAIATTSFMGFSFTFWHFSTDANAYIISAFFPVLASYLLLTMDNFPIHRFRLTWVSIVFSIGILLHQVVVLFYPVYFFWMVVFKFKDKKRKFTIPMRILLIILPALITGSMYFLIGRVFFQYTTPDEYWNWITSYGHQKRWWFGNENAGFLAFSRAVMVSHLKLMFYPDYIRYGLLNFSHLSIVDFIKKLLTLVSLITVFLVFIRGFIYLLGAIGKRRFYAALLLLWILPYFIFFTFFTPQFEFYRLYYLLPLMVIFALGLKGFFEKPSFEELDLPIHPNKLSGWVFVLLVVFGIYNYALGINPGMKEENNPWLMQARTFVSIAPSDSILVVPFSDERTEEYSRTANLVKYFGTQDVLFAKRHDEFVGPILDFVGPPIPSKKIEEPIRWDEIKLRGDVEPGIEKMLFHESLLDGRKDGWRIIKYMFPDTQIPLEGFVRLPKLQDCEPLLIGNTRYLPGKRFLKIPERVNYRFPVNFQLEYFEYYKHSEREQTE